MEFFISNAKFERPLTGKGLTGKCLIRMKENLEVGQQKKWKRHINFCGDLTSEYVPEMT